MSLAPKQSLSSNYFNAAVSIHGTVATEVGNVCLSATYCFFPIAIETFCALGEIAIDFLRDLGRRIANVTGNAVQRSSFYSASVVPFNGIMQRAY